METWMKVRNGASRRQWVNLINILDALC